MVTVLFVGIVLNNPLFIHLKSFNLCLIEFSIPDVIHEFVF